MLFFAQNFSMHVLCLNCESTSSRIGNGLIIIHGKNKLIKTQCKSDLNKQTLDSFLILFAFISAFYITKTPINQT